MEKYDHKAIEGKWRQYWREQNIYKTATESTKPKKFILDMFPYPSGAGLHVGHPRGYIATDVYSRFSRMNGCNVLHPMGWDAFGLPAENYAIKNQIHPSEAVDTNIQRFKEQLEIIGFDYDWDREINTTDPNYYRWTQWIFLKLYEKGLAYQSHEPINWCPSCQTGLANEDLEADGTCERCGSIVEKKPLRQWVLKIRDYADRLIEDLNTLERWPDWVKEAQRNWIGRSYGAEIKFAIKDSPAELTVFTTRPDTLFGATYMVIAPEHPLIHTLEDKITNLAEVKRYIESAAQKTEIDRTDMTKPKTGVELQGIKAINPANNAEIPVWIADYVLSDYGTGAIMAVPAHDERDHQFAIKYKLPIIQVVSPRLTEEQSEDLVHVAQNIKNIVGQAAMQNLYSGEGTLVNSGAFNEMTSKEAKEKITEFVGGHMVTSYKLRDWVFSRQRYWGEPIPLIQCEKCGVVPVPEDQLPVKLPDVEKYVPTGTGESPLADIDDWVNTTCPTCGGAAKRETNTMPQWAGSSWYWLRYIDPSNDQALVDPDQEKFWNPVDVYVGGDHATRHLIYARFWHKFLYDINVVSTIEPFSRLEFLGYIMAEDGRKMSKRWGNVINPDDVVDRFGADAFRTYEMFIGPFENTVPWSTDGLVGTRRFIEKVWRNITKVTDELNPDLDSSLHKTIKKVSSDIEEFKFNTAVSAMMIFINEVDRADTIGREQFGGFLRVLAPFAPHVADELWHQLGNTESIHIASWPVFDPDKAVDDSVVIAIQVNGKVRSQIELPLDTNKEDIEKQALADEKVQQWINDKQIKKVIVVPNKIVNIVIST